MTPIIGDDTISINIMMVHVTITAFESMIPNRCPFSVSKHQLFAFRQTSDAWMQPPEIRASVFE